MTMWVIGGSIVAGFALIGLIVFFALRQTPTAGPALASKQAATAGKGVPAASNTNPLQPQPSSKVTPPQPSPPTALEPPSGAKVPAAAQVAAQPSSDSPKVATTTPKKSRSAKKAKTKSSARSNSSRRQSKAARRRAERRQKASSQTQVAAAPKKKRPAPETSRSGKKDEVDELLGALDGGSKPARSASPSRSAAPAQRSAPAPAPSDPLLPEKLNARQISQVVKKNARSLLTCKNRDGYQEGIIMVNFKIGSSGRVSSAKVTTAKFKQTAVAQCVEGKVSAFRFPQFSGASMSINYPFRL